MATRKKVLEQQLIAKGKPVPFRLVRFRYEKGPGSWNRHTYFEIAFCTEGKGFLKTELGKINYRTGSAIINNAGTAHIFIAQAPSQFYFIQFDHTLVREFKTSLSEKALKIFFIDS